MIVTSEMRAQFDREGFFILEDFFSPEEIREITDAIDSHSEKHERELAAVGTQGISRAGQISFTSHLAERDERIAAFCRHPKLVALTRELIGPNVRLYWNQSVYKQPETPKEFPWHQDNGYTPVEPEQYYTCWLALTDSTVENGCVWVLPRSHKNGTLPHQDSPIGKVGYRGPDPGIPVPLKGGSMVVFSSLLLHRSGPNVSHGPRKAYVIQYCQDPTCLVKTGELVDDRLWIVRNGQPVTHTA